VGMAPVTMVVVLQLLLLGLFGLFATFFNYFDVIIENRGNDRHHISLDNSRPDTFSATDSNVYDALESQVPLPHIHHVFAAALLQNAHQSLDTAIDREDVSDAGRGCGEVCEMVERVDQRQRRCAIERPTVVKGSGDAH
jgi:hypothetical protein